MPVAYIGLGANLPSMAGEPAATLAAAAERMAASGHIIARSHLYSTAPVGFADQPRFVNAVAALETQLGPRALLDSLFAIEREFGRDRGSGLANGPRTLDLDILLYGDLIVSEAGLEIPHPRLAEREFVLVPLNEIAPHFRHPRTGAEVKELLQQLPSGLSPASNRTKDEVIAIENDCWRAGVACADSGDDRPRAAGGADPDND